MLSWGSTVLKSYYQTKIVEGGTKDEMRISNEALFNGQLPKLSTPTIEQSFCCSSFQNLRLGRVILYSPNKDFEGRTNLSECVFDARLHAL